VVAPEPLLPPVLPPEPPVPVPVFPEPFEAFAPVELEDSPALSPAVPLANPTEAEPMLPEMGQWQALSATVAEAASHQPRFLIAWFRGVLQPFRLRSRLYQISLSQ
jgi:hypothetical protein